jgi:hypothetical protein
VLLAGFILSDLNSGHLLDQCILTSVIKTILFLSRPGPPVPNPGQFQSVYDGLRTRIYTEQISASLQFGHGLDSLFWDNRPHTSISAARTETQHARLAGKTQPEAYP